MSFIRHAGFAYWGQVDAPSPPNAMAAAGAVNLDTYHTMVDTTVGTGHASTLGDGKRSGQLKRITLDVDAGDLVLTVANLAGGNTLTFNDAGDSALLVWDGTRWVPLEHRGVAISTV